MKKYICDRCGKEVKQSKLVTLTPYSDKLYNDIDLCIECFAKFFDFVDELGRCKIDLSKVLIMEEDDGKDSEI